MKIKVSINTPKIVLLIALLLYALSQQSWGGLISGTIMWRILFLGCVVFGITAFFKLVKTPSLYMVMSVAMIAVVLLFNNQNLSNGSNGYELVFCEIVLFSISAYRGDYWIKSSLKLMLMLGVFYALMTLLSFDHISFHIFN